MCFEVTGMKPSVSSPTPNISQNKYYPSLHQRKPAAWQELTVVLWLSGHWWKFNGMLRKKKNQRGFLRRVLSQKQQVPICTEQSWFTSHSLPTVGISCYVSTCRISGKWRMQTTSPSPGVGVKMEKGSWPLSMVMGHLRAPLDLLAWDLSPQSHLPAASLHSFAPAQSWKVTCRKLKINK